MAYRLSTLLGLKLQDDEEFASIVPTAENFEAVDAAIAADRQRLSAIETPSVTAAATLTTIQNGDTHKTILGKVKTLITQFLSHKGSTGSAHGTATTSEAGFLSADDKTKLDGIAEGATKYVHPSATARTSGLYKIVVDALGHVTGATAVQKSDITALGIPSTNTTYSAATQSAAGLMSAADKTKLDGLGSACNIDASGYANEGVTYAAVSNLGKGVQIGEVKIGVVSFPSTVQISASPSGAMLWKPESGWKAIAALPACGNVNLAVTQCTITSDGYVSLNVKNNGSSATDASRISLFVVLKKTT